MTIEDCKLIESTGAMGPEGVTYHQVWHAYFSGGYDAAAAVNATFAGLPDYGDDMDGDGNAYASKRAVALHDDDGAVDEGIAVYTLDYVQKKPNSVGGFPNPLDRPPVVSGGGSGETYFDTKDANDNRIVNSVGDLYDGIPDRPVRGGEFSITRNEADNPATMATAMSNTVNSAAWHGVAAGNARIGKITFTPKTEVVEGLAVNFWEVTYPILLRRDGWRLKPIDSGRFYYDDDDNLWKFTDKHNVPLDSPGLLDGAGGKLADGAPPVYYPEDGYPLLDEVSFSPLDLPDPFA